MTKKELRKLYKQRRFNISPKEKLKWDDLILLQLQKFDFGNADTLFTYWEMNNEPNTQILSSYLKHTIPNLQICYPVIDFATCNMNAILTNEDTIFTTNEYGITEPTHGVEMHAIDLDIIFVPLLICDMQGSRVGYGKGFYDKYLAQTRADAITIGFNYFAPIVKIDDAKEFDIPLNYCITPEKIYEF